MTMTIMTMTLIDSQYATEKARKAQKIFHKQQAFQIFCLSLHQSMCFCLPHNSDTGQAKYLAWHLAKANISQANACSKV